MTAMEKIDVLIPAIEKDLGVLPHVIDGIRKHVLHPIGTIFIVSPDSAKIRRMCAAKGCRFVNENRVLPLAKSDIRYSSKRWNRSGWMLQQLLKLAGDRICNENAFLVMDADTVLIRPHLFRRKGKTFYYCRGWSQPEYFRMHRRLLGVGKSASSSFVTHYMLFEKDKLARLKRTIEKKHGMKWYKAILRKIDRTKLYAFSEFETYGNFVYASNRKGCILRYARNRAIGIPIGHLSEGRRQELAAKYRSLSCHARRDYFRPKRADVR